MASVNYNANSVPVNAGTASFKEPTNKNAVVTNNGMNSYNVAQANQAAARRNDASNSNTQSIVVNGTVQQVTNPSNPTSYARQAANNMSGGLNYRASFRDPMMYGDSSNAFSVPVASQDNTQLAGPMFSDEVNNYINEYNADREQKIRDMYAGNLNSQNAGLKAALDTNLGTMKTAYDTNLGNLRTAYDNNVGSLKTAYDSNLGTLKTAYDTNVANLANAYAQQRSDAEAARDKISPQYQQSMNALSSEYERLRRNTNMQGATNGLNTGAGTQLALGQNMAYQRNQGNLARSENEALNEAERGLANLSRDYYNRQNILDTEYTNNRANIDTKYANETDRLNREYQNNLANYGTTYQNNIANLKTNYENQIAQAAANNDYQMAAALLDEYGNQFDRMQNQAALLAQFGDFSAYAALYGEETAKQMQHNWALNNPEVAWASGNLTAEDYYALTGRYPSDPAMGNTGMDMGGASYGHNGRPFRDPQLSRNNYTSGQTTGYYGR